MHAVGYKLIMAVDYLNDWNFVYLLQMVEATIILEHMIKTDCSRKLWWYWSSCSAVVQVSTISAPALRIYALDAAIIYRKSSITSEPEDTPKLSKPGKKKKDEDG